MSSLRVSVLIPTYKDIKALNLILDALKYQTYKNFEVIIAEDDNDEETKRFLGSYEAKFSIKHFFQEDMGNRKPRAINNAILISDAEYIIFIDGDTIPFSTFIEYHVSLSDKNIGLCGRRVNIGDKVSHNLRQGVINAREIEKNYVRLFRYLKNDNIRHYEQGFTLKPNSLIQKVLEKIDTNKNIVASNFSCYKEKLIEVNGIDESLPYAPSRDDYDLQWRLESIGVVMKSCKYCANLLHLNHARNDRQSEDDANKKIIEEKKRQGLYQAICGIKENR